jgi:hypothetical protein
LKVIGRIALKLRERICCDFIDDSEPIYDFSETLA